MFITIEGIEGSGKTTQIRHIAADLEGKGHECVTTREPGGTAIGEKIRSILLDAGNKDMDPVTELLLYTADRAQHIKAFVNPALSSGKTVVCDRYFDATMAYQGFARGLDIDLINKLHHLVLGGLKPDVTLLLDLSPEIGLSRAWNQINNGTRSGDETRFEEETLLFHEKVRAGYLALARNEPGRYRVIDASKSEAQVRNEIIKVLSVML
ncbi:MAG: dTMP kinase [Deltaproteobacteria bacterium]|nr:dTMP kinase [Deltaproteobacteria bacterium]